ncbi:helix-turn-helix domain-containing protein [Clostridium oryzae]|uniref:HTH-type transcriptional regulator Xre n=1 Tax=Clostridium oryzae TaxID=1450648 RepID=A0A1V4IKM7_9CLOT|nr:helix-turn-helix transcriptional regulator [Clostridium oryzae]OPJ60390.1 HTH-type transcriptional regulator Xre [Clostridium oryzae]
MKEINIGSKIATNRKKKGITQEQLADFLCVSKPAVSKWESGQSYPDITLLPLLATYFNISVDELLGYEPQMCKEDIKKLYYELSKKFVSEPFETVYSKCQQYIKKYFSCWELQYYMGVLLVNHCNLAGTKDKIDSILQEAAKIFDRVSHRSEVLSLAKIATALHGFCCINLNKADDAIDLLEGLIEVPVSVEVLLSKAYQMKGELKKAKSLMQRYIYQNVMSFFGACPDFMMLYIDDPEKAKECYRKTIEIGNTFEVEKMHPSSYFSLYITAAIFFAMQNDKEAALDALDKYIKILETPNIFPLKLQGNNFFDCLDEFFNSLDLGIETPRNEELIKQSIKESIVNNPAFKILEADERYERIIKRMNNLIK